MTAQTDSYTQLSSNRGASNVRAGLALGFGVVGALAIPVAIELTRTMTGADLLDAAFAIPVAAVAAVVSLILERSARGSRLLRATRVLAVTGICFTLSSALAIGVYEFLLWKEQQH